MNWYIGQKVVALESTPVSKLVKGCIYVVKDINVCSCGAVRLYVGLHHDYFGIQCETCKGIIALEDRMFHTSRLFAPIEPKQELSEHTTETLIEELEEQLQPC